MEFIGEITNRKAHVFDQCGNFLFCLFAFFNAGDI
jgi:hypothetical protein